MKKISNKLLIIVVLCILFSFVFYTVVPIVKYKNGTLLEWRNKMVREEYRLDRMPFIKMPSSSDSSCGYLEEIPIFDESKDDSK